jgi:nucleoside triphosphate diphosphatase
MTELERLLQVMARLRDPERGCPWDVEQTFATIAPYTIEEAYEVAEAIARDDPSALKDELGDLLLQVVFHARMAEETGEFDFRDVAGAIAAKLIRRHPHVFADVEYADAAEQTADWERIKAEERAAAGQHSVFDGVPLALPALARAAKLQKRAARVGFDWPSIEPVLDKLDEELAELRAALAAGEPSERLAEELGDLLFVCANLGRHLHTDPETALRAANDKFVRRFRRIEALLREQDRQPEDLTLAELDALWEQAKSEERAAAERAAVERAAVERAVID